MSVKKQNKAYLFVKRLLDIVISVIALIFLIPVTLVIFIIDRFGDNKGPVFYKQKRVGKDHKIFYMYKYRSMIVGAEKRLEEDPQLYQKYVENGYKLPPDEDPRITKFGRFLRKSSIDELPQFFNILKGDMSVVGPRPQLVRDMVFMSDTQRMRHTAKPGLSGLAQVNGRNAVSWEDKIKWDLKYIEKVSFVGDIKIVWQTFKKVFVRSNITESNEEIDVTLDYGDALLKEGKVSKEEYDAKQAEARRLLGV